MVRVVIKWNKQVFDDVELDPATSPAEFKALIYSLTGVPPERQKLMTKGAWKGLLKDEMDFSSMTIPAGLQITLMGTAEVLQAPQRQTTFLEDMSTEDQAKSGAMLPSGLVNMGNTCFMNSTLQCLRYIPELRNGLDRFNDTTSPTAQFTAALGATYRTLDTSVSSQSPVAFVTRMRSLFPQLATTTRGHYQQQDAEELYNAVTSTLALHLRYNGTGQFESLVDALLGLEMEERWRCNECDSEPEVRRVDRARKLVCNIQGGAGTTTQINHLHEGLRLGFEGVVEKNSEILGRNALWRKTSRLARLPPYLCIQFMRFFWKATPEARDHAGVKTKILRPVTYPETFDIFEFCTDRVQAILRQNRDRHSSLLDQKAEQKTEKRARLDNGAASEPMDVVETKTDDTDAESAALASALALSMGVSSPSTSETKGAEMSPIVDAEGVQMLQDWGLPSDFTGLYELFAIVTHKGRSADSGHYMGWVRVSGNQWVVFDDDEVSECDTEYVLNLKGGGDQHMAYLAFYRAKSPTS